MDISRRIIPYEDLVDSTLTFDNDPFDIAKYFSEGRKKTFLNNPNLNDYKECALLLAKVDGIICGRAMHFPTKIYVDGKSENCLSGSSLEVAEQYRHLAVGADLMMYPVFTDKRDFVLAAGISEQALPMYKKLKYNILDYSRLVRINNTSSILVSKGINGILNKSISFVSNKILRILYWIVGLQNKSHFEIRQTDFVPESITKISVPKGYRYMEIHDAQWLQWCLDYNFTSESRNRKGFYIISKDGKDIGFFMLKETFRKDAGGLKNILLGSIIEWGSLDSNILSESEIYNIAIPLFSKSVDLIEIATSDETTERRMKRKGFLNFRKAHIVFKDKKKKYPEAKDINNWRIRLGYADVPFT